MKTEWFEFYKAVAKPSHIVIYKRYGKGPFRDQLVWNSRTPYNLPSLNKYWGGLASRILLERAQ